MTDLIYMLTKDDVTIPNALEVVDDIMDTDLRYIGFKDPQEGGLPVDKYKPLMKKLRETNMEIMIEVVSESEELNQRSAKLAVDLGVDYLIGGTFIDSSMEAIKGTDIGFFPYIGEIVGHPCVLEGSIEAMVEEGKMVKTKGIAGINLLAYRREPVSEVPLLIQEVQKAVGLPLIIAGSINSFERIKKMKELDVWTFTIGGAIQDGIFVPGGTIKENINAVLDVL
jgi:putative N-acetylmannosamine-6-phosphate epimerase